MSPAPRKPELATLLARLGRGAVTRMPRGVQEQVSRARAVLQSTIQAQTSFRFSPAGLRVLLRQQRLPHSGPSLLYRLNGATLPAKIGVIDGPRRLTFRELDDRIDQLAWGLRQRHSIGRGDLAILVMHNRTELLETQAAMARLGGGAVQASWRSTPAEIEYLVRHSGARLVFVEDTFAAAFDPLRGTDLLPENNFVVVGAARPGYVRYENVFGPVGRSVEDAAEGGAVVIYTSGTTGKPKGAVRRFPKDGMYDVLRFLNETPMKSDDRHLVVCPMYHSTAFGFLNFTFVVGGTVVIERGFEPESFLATVERERITTTAVVPTMLHRLLELPVSTRRRYDISSLRAIFSNAAPLTGTLARRAIDAFGPILYNCYGATEIGLVTFATPDELLRSPGTIGHGVEGTELRILDNEGRDVPPGTTGELYARNAMLIAGYHRDDAATVEAMVDGFFSVGDLAHVDEHGLFHIDGRKRDMIISGGVNVYPAEVEDALDRHPEVAEAAVVGVPDEEWGERVRAFVVLKAGSTARPEDILAALKRDLAGPKVPRELIVLDALPRNPTGKVLKRELRERT